MILPALLHDSEFSSRASVLDLHRLNEFPYYTCIINFSVSVVKVSFINTSACENKMIHGLPHGTAVSDFYECFNHLVVSASTPPIST